MKRLFVVLAATAFVSCDVDINDEKENKLDSFVNRADTTLERWGDSAKEKYKDIRDGVEDRLDRDSARKD